MSVICKICSEETRIIKKQNHKSAGGKIYHHCLICDFIFLDDKFIVTPEEELSIYDSHENSIEDPRYVAFFQNFIDAAIIDYIRANNIQGLDFGSGPEPVLAMLLKRKYGWSMDIYDKFYAPGKIYVDKKYDLITATEVVEHLKDPLKYFRLFKNLLRSDGLLSVMTLFHPDNNEDFADWFYPGDPSHIAFYSRRTMEVIATLLDFNIVYCDNNRYISFTHVCPP